MHDLQHLASDCVNRAHSFANCDPANDYCPCTDPEVASLALGWYGPVA